MVESISRIETPRDGHLSQSPSLWWAFSLAARGRRNQEAIPSPLPNLI